MEVGYSSMEALISGTGIAAQVLGLEEEVGTISEGKPVDLVVVEGDPMEEIGLLQNAESISSVFQGGLAIRED